MTVKRAPCPFCGRPNKVRLQPQALYTKDKRGVAVLTPAGFAALDRYHEMTDRIEELNQERDIAPRSALRRRTWECRDD